VSGAPEKRADLARERAGIIEALTRDVDLLAAQLGPRNLYHYAALTRAADHCERSFREMGYTPLLQQYQARHRSFRNISAEIEGSARPEEIVVIGAHYDSHKNSPGANDNASAIAALLHLGRAFAGSKPARTIRLVAFTNEESPFTRTRQMGSRVYANQCRMQGENVVAMLGLEMLGCHLPAKGAQWLSLGGYFLPRHGDFLAIVGNRASRPLLDRVAQVLGADPELRIFPVTLPTHFPGARSSDHWSFWMEGFQAVMATDTGPLRYRHYHRRSDTPDKVNFAWLAQTAVALERVIRALANPPLDDRDAVGTGLKSYA
jgi:Zn-dependent M28 family amino/carboxypeptidase